MYLVKTCSACGQPKPLDDFNRRKNVPDGRAGRCRTCTSAAERRRRAADPERYREYDHRHKAKPENKAKAAASRRQRAAADPERAASARRRHRLKASYGITIGEYELLLAEQQSACAICGGPPVGRGAHLHVDHDHTTGRVRGLLCTRCNLMIGCALDDPSLLRAGATYLDASGRGLAFGPSPPPRAER